MFSTHSAVSQLKPDTVVLGVRGAEEALYSQGDVFGSSLGGGSSSVSGGSGPAAVPSSGSVSAGGAAGSGAGTPSGDGGDLGSVLLGCGSCVQDIHAYFKLLESRTCRVSLGARRTQNSIRTVPKLVQPDDGSAKTSRQAVEVLYLDSRDLRVFKHAYLCAVYPVLAAPGPPSPVSPSPKPLASRRSSYKSNHSGASGSAEVQGARTTGPQADAFLTSISPLSPEPVAHSSNLIHGSPCTFHDSGVEESDEAGLIGLIPMESLCQLLQRAFGLSSALFRQQEADIVRAYSKAKKSSQKVLAEELTGQLAVLENNSHPFYAPNHFITRNGYDLWQKQERIHIAELLAKFWQHSLPLLRDHQNRIVELQGVHEDYQILLRKLLDYESRFRDETNSTSALTFTPLSSASCRLLLEFGLRYGIGEMFRKTLLLQNLISEFSPTVGYVTYLNNLVLSIKYMLPNNKAAVVMVKQELDVLHSSLRVLKMQTCKALNQMKDLFSDNRPANGIGLLLSLLKSVMGLMAYLAPSNAQLESYKSCVHDTVMGIFRPHYGKIKAAVWVDCDQGRGKQITPQMLNMIIGDIQSEVSDFRNNFEGAFQKFFSISKMAATHFYDFLMEDVEVFCQTSVNGKIAIDRQTLALAYRLNQLDSEWGSFILPKYQTWRISFLPKLDKWTDALKLISQQFILKAVSGDRYLSQKIELPQPLVAYQDPSQLSERNSCSISVVSITPSINSAFSSIMSSIRSTPCHMLPVPKRKSPDGKMKSMFVRKLPTPSIEIDQATGLLLQEKEPVTFTASSLDSTLLKSSMSQGNFGHQSQAQPEFVSLPDNLDGKHAFTHRGNAKDFDRAKSISAWTEEVARHRPLPVRPHSQAGSTDRMDDRNWSSEAVTLGLSDSDKVAASDGSLNASAAAWKPLPSLTIPPSRYTPYSSDGEEARGSASTVDHGTFSFPPLSVDSDSRPHTVDFSQPVFERPQSRSLEPGQRSGSRQRGRGLSAQGSTTSPSTLLHRQNLSSFDMVASNSTITITDTREAILSTSASVVDVIVLLQRLCSFSSNLLGIFLSRDQPQFDKTRKNSVQRFRSKESFLETGEKDIKAQKPAEATDSATKPVYGNSQSLIASSGSDKPVSLSGFKSWSTFTTTFSTTQSHPGSTNKVDMSSRASSVKASDGTDTESCKRDSQDATHQDIRRDPRHAVVRTPSRMGQSHQKPSQEEPELLATKTFSKLKTRLKLHLQILRTMCNILTVYTTNILCMDLCGTPKAVAKKLIGANMVNFVRRQQEDGAVWGCRHQREVPYGCLYYFNRRVDYLCERYEPVTQHMCTRVNNAFACLYILDEYCDRLASVFGLEEDGQDLDEEDEDIVDKRVEEDLTMRGAQMTASGRSDGSGFVNLSTGTDSVFEIISSSSGYLTSDPSPGAGQNIPGNQQQPRSRHEDFYVSSEEDSLSDTACGAPSKSLKQRWRTQVQQTCLAARHHLLATVTSMCRLQAYKLNLFVRDGLPMLLRLKDPAVTMDSCLSPIITFMHRYLDSLSGWLYRDCFRRVLDYLWVLIVQDIEFHANRLLSAEAAASSQAHDWMLAVGVLIKFMNNNGRGIKKELLLAQANNVIFRLQLFTLSTKRLITLFYKLRDYHTEVDELTLEENATRNPPAIIHRIHGELQSLRKCFSGSELVHWIVKNRSVLPADLSVVDEEITKDIAIEIAQDLLDNHFIIELESVLHTESATPTSALDQFSPYPQLSIHSHVPSEAEDSSWEDAEGRRVRNQFYQPNNNQDYVRSVSSSGYLPGQAVYSQQQAEVHSSFPPLSARSSPGSVTPTEEISSPRVGKRVKESSNQKLNSPAGPGPLGLGARYSPASATAISSQYSSARDQLSPGPTHHDVSSERSSAEPRQGFTEASCDRTSPNTTLTPTRQQFLNDGNTSQSSGPTNEQSAHQDIRSSSGVLSDMEGQNLHLRETEFLGSLGSRASVADFRPSGARPQPHSPQASYGKLRRDSDVLSEDSAALFGRSDLMNGVSPFSSLAELTYLSNGKKFVPGSKHFYFIHQSVLNPSLSLFRQRQLKEERGLQHRHRALRKSRQSADHYKEHCSHGQPPDSPFDMRQVKSAPPRGSTTPTNETGTVSPGDTIRPSSATKQHSHRGGGRNECEAEIPWQQKNAMENLALVEQCISHKISTEYVAAIIVGRRKSDKLAKEFFKLSVTG